MVNARRKYEDELEDQIIGGGSMQIIHEIGVGIDLGTAARPSAVHRDRCLQ